MYNSNVPYLKYLCINFTEKVEQTGTLAALKFGEVNRGNRPFPLFYLILLNYIGINIFSKIQLVVYHQCCILIG